MSLLNEVKQDLRRNHNKTDEIINADIQTALEFIRTAGVRPDTSDKLVRQAVRFYLRYTNNFDGRGPEHKEAFNNLLATMTLSSKRRLDEE